MYYDNIDEFDLNGGKTFENAADLWKDADLGIGMDTPAPLSIKDRIQSLQNKPGSPVDSYTVHTSPPKAPPPPPMPKSDFEPRIKDGILSKPRVKFETFDSEPKSTPASSPPKSTPVEDPSPKSSHTPSSTHTIEKHYVGYPSSTYVVNRGYSPIIYRKLYDWGIDYIPSYYSYSDRQRLESLLESLIKRELNDNRSEYELKPIIKEFIDKRLSEKAPKKTSTPKKKSKKKSKSSKKKSKSSKKKSKRSKSSKKK